MSDYWKREFEKHSVLWMHDGNPARPYVRMSSGLLTSGYFNCDALATEHPELFRRACVSLSTYVSQELSTYPTRVISAANGGIALSACLGEIFGVPYVYAHKRGMDFAFSREFQNEFTDGEQFLLCDGTISTGSTIHKLRKVLHLASPSGHTLPVILAICNRSGLDTLEGKPVRALIEQHLPTWQEGENPFTPDGRELVEPVTSAKTNWDQLTREYA